MITVVVPHNTVAFPGFPYNTVVFPGLQEVIWGTQDYCGREKNTIVNTTVMAPPGTPLHSHKVKLELFPTLMTLILNRSAVKY
jgi:hypothetical protein